ncbi:Armadillo-type fold containing protein [Trema orientale]|uniref:Armadillo-type fold containing protein n=1 Tax=Trema orientale TaxID=63057 RepID=A0A2P5FLS1_TREOI|nr:Armadillo-type fold containing protein [Trema orientale]
MAVGQEARAIEEEEEEDVEVEEQQQQQYAEAPSHHPFAPPHQLFDVSTTVDPSYVISLIRKLVPTNVTVKQPSHTDNVCVAEEGMDLDNQPAPNPNHNSVSLGEEAWEEYGCTLWDLSATKTHAEMMVENLLLEVLSANLMVQQSMRAIEICLGIIGNLACHEVPLKHIVSTNGLTDLIVNQLFVDDTQCLCEACRLFSLGLRSSESGVWAAALRPEHILCRILWIAENSLNLQLVEKTVDLLLAISESSQEVVQMLLPPLMKMGLPSSLLSLLACEVNILITEKVPERLSILDVILRAIEAISVIDGHSQEISSNKELFQVVCQLVKLPDKAELANSCITAAVLIANILSDVPGLASEILHEARSALWNIMARLLFQVQESEMSTSALIEYVSVLASKSEQIEDDLLDCQLDGLKSRARTAAWTATKDDAKEKNRTGEDQSNDVDICRLLDCCRRHTK